MGGLPSIKTFFFCVLCCLRWGDENGPLPDEIRFANLKTTSTWINVKNEKRSEIWAVLVISAMAEDYYRWNTIEIS